METTRSSSRERHKRSDAITRQARALVESQLHLANRAKTFDFSLHDDVLIVRGTVPTYYLKQVLQHALKNLEGVRWIDNQVTVAANHSKNGRDNGLS